MPSLPSTPERLLGRNDSKNPASTCKGITSSGRACRRALAASPGSRRTSDALNGVVALVHEDGAIREADFYCWQHKDQAEQRVEDGKQNAKKRRAKRRSTELFPLQEKSSIDTMMQRLGLDVEEEIKGKKTKNPRPPKKTQTNDFAAGAATWQAPHAQKYGLGQSPSRPTSPKAKGFWASLCCMTGGDDDYVEIVRHKKRVEQTQMPEMAASRPAPSLSAVPGRNPVANSPTRPAVQQRRSSNAQTNTLLSLIPQNLSPQMTSTLLAELVKPISSADEEGYIYIFWLTPQSNSQPSESTARSLLAPPSARPQHERRISDVMTEFSFDGSEETTRGGGIAHSSRNRKQTIMLKIGRANNVTRRMNEWQRQCGYALNLVRWYPYVSSSSSATPSRAHTPSARRLSQLPLYPDLSRPPSCGSSPTASRRPSEGVRKVPYVKRVERLIHLELAEQRVLRQCPACGKEHREWFEVDASTAGVKAVDETVRRWVEWAVREAAGTG